MAVYTGLVYLMLLNMQHCCTVGTHRHLSVTESLQTVLATVSRKPQIILPLDSCLPDAGQLPAAP